MLHTAAAMVTHRHDTLEELAACEVDASDAAARMVLAGAHLEEGLVIPA